MMQGASTRETDLPLEDRYRQVLVEPTRKGALQSPAKCMIEFVFEEVRHVYDGDSRM